ncbi:MAG TPA: hypothetical protein VIT18_05400 [Terrimicrobiaceae bacterium]
MKTDTYEKGLETLIMHRMTGADCLSAGASGIVAETAPKAGGSGWFAGSAAAYDCEFGMDMEQFFAFCIARTEREIALMQEYRTRLTADAVTGKLDVRAAAAHLPALPADSTLEPVADEPLDETETEETGDV